MVIRKLCFTVIVVTALMFAALPAGKPTNAQDEYWPTDSWRTSTPEEQGFDSTLLLEVPKIMQENERVSPINSVLVIRNGYVVLDASIAPFRSDKPHALYSVTKSFLSTVVGIAIDKGYIEGVDQSVWDYFDPSVTADMNEHKEALAIDHLLSMTSGMQLSQAGFEMYALGPDDQSWVQYMLDRRVIYTPGQYFSYADGVSQLTSAIVSEATGMSAYDFAQPNLFAPLGITDVTWLADPQGVSCGGDAMYLSPLDMAKLGYLYLHQGEWDGQQIVSSAWVEAATTNHSLCATCPTYGYYWWLGLAEDVPPEIPPYYAAHGYMGQQIVVFPDKDLILVTTGNAESNGPASWAILEAVIAALSSDEPLPANPDAVATLDSAVEALANPTPLAAPPAPAFQQEINGVTFDISNNPMGWSSLAIEFGESEALLWLETEEGTWLFPVGLDNVYRLTPVTRPAILPLLKHDFWALPRVTDVTLALKGYWHNDDVFTILMHDDVGLETWIIAISPHDEGIQVTVSEQVQVFTQRVRGMSSQ